MSKKNKQGAASFYVVAFSTLILLIVVASFTALVISQVTRSSNDDLSRSAYDSALAGVEDAKLAFFNYQNCLAQGAVATVDNNDSNLTCGEIIGLVEASASDFFGGGGNCDVVARILGRTIDSNNGVAVSENKKNNNMQQYYTCVKMQTTLKDYRATLSSASSLKVIQAKFDSVRADDIKTVKISWGSSLKKQQVSGTDSYFNASNNSISFPAYASESRTPNPSALGFAIVQAGDEYKMSDFDLVSGQSQTNRGQLYLVPIGEHNSRSGGNYFPTTGEENFVSKNYLVKSNDKTPQNLPVGVECDEYSKNGKEFACSAMIELPEPIGGKRADDNFIIAVTLPFGNPTDFALEFFCADGQDCAHEEVIAEYEDSAEAIKKEQANLKGVQVAVDSTGKANDLYRRVEARLEGSDSMAISLLGPLELFGGNGGSGGGGNGGFKKDLTVTCEYDFAPTCE